MLHTILVCVSLSRPLPPSHSPCVHVVHSLFVFFSSFVCVHFSWLCTHWTCIDMYCDNCCRVETTKTFIILPSNKCIRNCINEEESIVEKRMCASVCLLCWCGGNDSMHASIYIRISFSKGSKEKKKEIVAFHRRTVRPYFPLSFAYAMRAFFKGALCVGLKIKSKYAHMRSDRVRKTPTEWLTTHCIHTMSSLFRCWYFFFAISAEWPTITQWPNWFACLCLCVFSINANFSTKISFNIS